MCSKLCLLFPLSFVFIVQPLNANPPCVTIQNGTLCGLSDTVNGTQMSLFYSVPYAKQIVKDTRFVAPEPSEAYKETLNATTLPTVCAQLNATSFIGHMNCLFLNIYVPSTDFSPKEPLQVMVFIHGGAYLTGGASLYDSRLLSQFGKVIIVTINYRLGMFGFGYLPGTDMAGNLGLLDQRLAIQWVKENIDKFGGNPNTIALFGESAGAGSVSAHIGAPASRSLFTNAITESGSISCQWSCKSDAYMADLTRMYASATGCTNSTPADILACMNTKKTSEIVTAYDPISNSNKVYVTQFLSPIEDDTRFFDGNAHSLQKNYNYQDHSFLFGANGEEGGLFLPYLIPNIFSLYNNLSHSGYYDNYGPQVLVNIVGLTLPQAQKAVLQFYAPPRNIDYFNALLQLTSDFFMRCCGGLDSVFNVSPTSKNTYTYLFNHTTTYNQQFKELGPYHSVELQFVFGWVFSNPQASEEEKALSLQMMQYWTNFAKTGHPTNDISDWPAATGTSTYATTLTKVLDVGPSEVRKGLNNDQCSFWDQIYQFMPKERINYVS